MTTIPVELAEAREACTQAWNEYFVIIEREHTYEEYHQALNKAGAADDLCSDLYRRWQAVGGTSDIESIEAAELAAEQHKALQIVLDVASAQTPAEFGPQEPPQDYRIFNKRQADGTYRPLSEFFDGKPAWMIEAEAQAADYNDLKATEENARY